MNTAEHGNDTIIYHPIVVVELHLRLDGTLHGLNTAVDAAGYGQQSAAPGGNGIRSPMLFDGSSADNLDFLVYVTPVEATWEFPAHRICGSWTCKFAYQDLPVDPRIFSAVGVSIYADTISADRFSNANSGSALIDLSNGSPQAGKLPEAANLIITGPADMISMSHDDNGSYLTLTGRDMRSVFIDSPFPAENIAALDMSQPIDKLVATIIASHPRAKDMIMSKNDPDSAVDYATLQQTRATTPTLVSNNAQNTANFTTAQVVDALVGGFIRINEVDWLKDGVLDLPAPLNDAKPIPRVRKNAKSHTEPKKSTVKWAATKTRASAPTNENTSYWDMITQCCYLVSAIPVFYGQFLYIRNSLTMQNLARYADGSDDKPTIFANGEPRVMPNTPQINLPVMLYGSNLSSFKIDRKLQGHKAMAVRVMAYDTSSKEKGLDKYREVEWPIPPIMSTDSPSGRGSESSYIRVKAPGGVTDTATMLKLAEAIFKETMRYEISGAFETKNLASLGGGNADPDLLRLRTGAAIVVDVAGSRFDSFPPYISALVRDRSIPESTAIDQVASLLSGNTLTRDAAYLNKGNSTSGGSKLSDFARAIVRAMRGTIVELPKTFYVSTVHVSWSAESGMKIAADFINYIEAQVDKLDTTDDGYSWQHPPASGMDKKARRKGGG